jgi:Domain of unknown function (DUF4365)
MTNDMGPLPEGDRQDSLQQLSLNALRNLLPQDRFLVRDERMDDKGVDVALEAKLTIRKTDRESEQFTNCRAQAQLKGTDSTTRNRDGSVSYQIDVSNLNYLLNGPCPIYFLWIEPAKEMRYAWAREEWRRLDLENPHWKEQGTVTVRFREVLNPEVIYERIVAEARFAREIHETLARDSLAERVVVSIDPKTLASDDPKEIFKWITSSGMAIASSGFGKLLLRWLDVLSAEQKRDARVQLVAAFTQAGLGRYHAALGHVAEAASRRAALLPSDQRVLDQVRDVCRYQTGAMDQEEYLRREIERSATEGGASGAAHKMEAIRLERLSSSGRPRRSELLVQMRGVLDEMEAAGDASAAQLINARLHVLYGEGEEITNDMTSRLMMILSRRDMGLPTERQAEQAALENAAVWTRWEARAHQLIREAAAEKHPLLLAEAMTVRLTVYQSLVANQRMEAFIMGEEWAPPADLCHTCAAEVEQAVGIFRQAENLEGETRAKLLRADFHYMMGELHLAKQLANDCLPTAEAMGYRRLESHARQYTEGPTHFERFQASVAEGRRLDDDVNLAGQTDEELHELSIHSLRTMGLPADRLPVVERDWHAMRMTAQQRVNWCRYLNMKQDLRHMQSPLTAYMSDPPRGCVCEKHGHHANTRHTDPAEAISSFKTLYCTGCPDQLPKA